VVCAAFIKVLSGWPIVITRKPWLGASVERRLALENADVTELASGCDEGRALCSGSIDDPDISDNRFTSASRCESLKCYLFHSCWRTYYLG
jgi:hypothetical protein